MDLDDTADRARPPSQVVIAKLTDWGRNNDFCLQIDAENLIVQTKGKDGPLQTNLKELLGKYKTKSYWTDLDETSTIIP